MADRESEARRGIDRAAQQWRDHLSKCGRSVTHEQARDRVRNAVVKDERSNQR